MSEKLSSEVIQYRARTIIRCLEFMSQQVNSVAELPPEFMIVKQRVDELYELIDPLTNE